MLSVDEAILSRRSVRAFRPDPVSRETVEHILEVDSKNPIALSLLASLEMLYGDENRVQVLLNRLFRCKSTDRNSLALGKIIQREMKKDKDNNVIYDSELCRFVISFNIEYLANDQTLSQLEPSPCPSNPAWGGAGGDDPLGNGAGPNDTGSAPYRVPYVRITIVIVDDAAERQERAILKTISIPMG